MRSVIKCLLLVFCVTGFFTFISADKNDKINAKAYVLMEAETRTVLESENADIRLLDFGLSKIIGPTEKCTEPYGTLSYVAPEVLKEKPYDKSVDLWSIGIITYLLILMEFQ